MVLSVERRDLSISTTKLFAQRIANMSKVLTGHVSPETAYVVDDYPYGFKLRCKIRYWIETKKGKGQRVVSQTTNPKASVEIWNKPKASTYSEVRFLILNESNGHVENDGIDIYAGPSNVDRIRKAYYSQFDFALQTKFDLIEKFSRKLSPISWGEWDAKQAVPVEWTSTRR